MKWERTFVDDENLRLGPPHGGFPVLLDFAYQLSHSAVTKTNAGKRMDSNTADVTGGDTWQTIINTIMEEILRKPTGRRCYSYSFRH